MFEQLQNRFKKIFKVVRGHGKISEGNIEDAIREIRIALLESDVNFKVVSSFINRVKKKSIGSKVFDSVTPGQQFIKLVLDELISFLDTENSDLNVSNKSSSVFVLAGLQGSGKTTTAAKIAGFLKREQHKNPLLVGADLQRLAAQEQLKILSNKVEVDFFSGKYDNPLVLVKDALKFASKNKNDVVIIDTAGRLHIDESLMDELQTIVEQVIPDEILYVIDGMTGQDAINSTKIFSEKIDLTGSIITKMDGNSGGGAALSVKEISKKPIKLMTTGENINDIEVFDPNRIAKRILGLSDVVGLVEKAQKNFDQKKAQKIQEKLLNNEFNFNDFSEQIKQFDQIGSISEMTKFIPGLKKMKNLNFNKNDLLWTQAIINSMTKSERENPAIINGSRRVRIAKGSGRSVSDVNRLIKQFNQIKIFMKKTKKLGMGRFPFKLN